VEFLLKSWQQEHGPRFCIAKTNALASAGVDQDTGTILKIVQTHIEQNETLTLQEFISSDNFVKVRFKAPACYKVYEYTIKSEEVVPDGRH
jgi:hypothetical protein